MASTPPSPSPSPSNAVESGPETLKPLEQENANSARPVSPTVEPVREEQVQNAVKFLSHPKVRGSPVIHRWSFLEKKGLTREEIDEAFRRVPDPSSSTTSAVAAASDQGLASRQATPSSSLQAQAPIATTLPASVHLAGVPASSTYRFQLSHAFIAIGALAASGAGTALLFNNVILPRVKAWICEVVREDNGIEKKGSSKSDPILEAAKAAKDASAAAAMMAQSCQELLNARAQEEKSFEAFKNLLNVQMEEVKSMCSAIRRLESSREVTIAQDKVLQERSRYASGNGTADRVLDVDSIDNLALMQTTKQAKTNGKLDSNAGLASASPAAAPYSKSYMEIMSMVQRGETPPGVREINDMPPNPNQAPTNPRIAPRTKPWEGIQQDQLNRDLRFQSQTTYDGYSSQTNTKPVNGSGSFWEQKTLKFSEVQPEIEKEKTVSFGSGSSIRRGQGWVPPQAPSVVIPEAAVAIRQPKSSASRQEEITQGAAEMSEAEVEIRQPDSSPSEHQAQNGQPIPQYDIVEDVAAARAISSNEAGVASRQQVVTEGTVEMSGEELVVRQPNSFPSEHQAQNEQPMPQHDIVEDIAVGRATLSNVAVAASRQQITERAVEMSVAEVAVGQPQPNSFASEHQAQNGQPMPQHDIIEDVPVETVTLSNVAVAASGQQEITQGALEMSEAAVAVRQSGSSSSEHQAHNGQPMPQHDILEDVPVETTTSSNVAVAASRQQEITQGALEMSEAAVAVRQSGSSSSEHQAQNGQPMPQHDIVEDVPVEPATSSNEAGGSDSGATSSNHAEAHE